MSREDAERAAENDMLDKLASYARGWDPMTGERVNPAAMLAAQKQYNDAKDMIDKRRIEREKISLDQQRALTERQKVDNERLLEETRLAQLNQIELQRLELEAERIKIQKAEVIVKALEIAAHAGVAPQDLLVAIGNFTGALLPGPAQPVLELEDKERG